jgi:transposase
VGLDVHARSVVAGVIDDLTGDVLHLRVAPQVEQVVAWVLGLPGPVAVAYEAGPTGFALARALRAAGVRCEVVAPSKMERPAGDRVKTDRRDARRLARLLRIGEVPVIRVPSQAEEAARDLVRAREDARGDLMRARHRVSKLLLRQGLVFDGTAWTAAHEQWLRSIELGGPGLYGLPIAYDEALEAVWAAHARRDRLDAAIGRMAGTRPWAAVVGRLACLRGISTLTGFALATEIGDWERFTGNSIGSYLGLVPSEASTGGRRVQGPITKTGNGHARRLLVEAAWHHRKRYRATRELLRRQEGQPAPVRRRADAGNRRLHRRWAHLDARGKRSTVSVVAIARELAGWCWSLAIMDDHPTTSD